VKGSKNRYYYEISGWVYKKYYFTFSLLDISYTFHICARFMCIYILVFLIVLFCTCLPASLLMTNSHCVRSYFPRLHFRFLREKR